MSTKNIAIAYCADNERAAREIEQKLRPAGYHFNLISCTRTTAGASLPEQLLAQPYPVLLLVSDNFLKSAQCMARGLRLLQEKRHQILPVVIDGVAKDEQSDEWTTITTDFERVSDIIQYINYWQDQYLDLRRQKRQMKDYDEQAFNEHLKVMREISSEAGEFLRVLRSMDFRLYPDFKANAFESFFLFTNDHNSWHSFKAQYQEEQAPALDDRLDAEEITEAVLHSSEEIAEEPPIDFSQIPGIALLPSEEEAPEEIAENPQAVSTDEAPTIEWENPAEAADPSAAAEEENMLEPEEPELEPAIEDIAGQPWPDYEYEDAEQMYNAPPQEEVDEEEEEEEEEIPAIGLEDVLNHIRAGQVQEGLALIAQAVEDKPEDTYLRYHYALLLAQHRQDYAAARRELHSVVESEPDNENALFLMGELEELLHDFQAAHQYYSRLVALNPVFPNAAYRLGMIIAGHFPGQEEEAAHYFKQAGKQDPSNADAFYQYGLLLAETFGKPKKAIKYFKKAIDSSPLHPFAHYDLALAYHQLGEREAALKAYNEATQVNPELKTPENDLAFSPQREEPASVRIATAIGLETIEALKNNINHLEELLRAREEESLQLRQEIQDIEEVKAQRPSVDQTVLVTGATSGIGRATAEIFARNGYRVIITGRRADRLASLKDELQQQYHAEVHAIQFDVRDEQAGREAVESLEGRWRDIDILVNNAGKAKGFTPIYEGKLEHWEEMIDTNLKGLLYITRAVSPGMVARKSGHIINICSTAGKEPYPNGNVYCATKAAVDMLTKSIRMDLYAHKVRVSMVSPAHVEETEFALVRFDGDEDKAQIYQDFKPLSSAEVAQAVFFIASQPPHVNILDIVIQGTQQASSMLIDRSGRAE
jgi:NADP-dependent 3-hydroxy acid dehydrogenase YdfG/tetratricopeptide (TPR) repeat protein